MSDQGQGPHQQQSQQYNASYAQHLAQFATSPGVQNVVPSSKQNALDTDRPRGGGWTKGFPHNKRANAMFRTELSHAFSFTDRQHVPDSPDN